jgi:hypothetical protein
MAKERRPLPKIEKNRECLKTDCKRDLHCFRQEKRRRPKQILTGQGCYSCGVDLVDWEMVYQRNIENAQETFQYMRKEWIRNKYWTQKIDSKAFQSAKKIGKNNLQVAIEKRLISSVGGAHPFRDGGQTPMDGNILYYAQHATACCCRKCIEYWHGIQAGKELTKAEILYLGHLMHLYINDRLPNLNEVGEKVPRKNKN